MALQHSGLSFNVSIYRCSPQPNLVETTPHPWIIMLTQNLPADYWILIIAICTFLLVGGFQKGSDWVRKHRLLLWSLPWGISGLWAAIGLGIVGYGNIGACKCPLFSLNPLDNPSSRSKTSLLLHQRRTLTQQRVLVHLRQNPIPNQLPPSMGHHNFPPLNLSTPLPPPPQSPRPIHISRHRIRPPTHDSDMQNPKKRIRRRRKQRQRQQQPSNSTLPHHPSRTRSNHTRSMSPPHHQNLKTPSPIHPLNTKK